MRYILIALGVLLLIIFGIVIFNRGAPGTGTKKVVVNQQEIKINDLGKDADASVSYTQEGPINALENHRTVKITVSQTSRNFTLFTGYQGQVLNTQTFPNDVDSFTAFLAALNRANFTRSRPVGNNVSPASICSTGNRTHYVIENDNKEVMDLWSASCNSGSFAGNRSLTATLFKTQIPNYSQLTTGVNITGTTNTSTF